MKKMFVTYWATFGEGDLSNSFMGNIEVTANDFKVQEIIMEGIDSVRYLERYIQRQLNEVTFDGEQVVSITVMNWRSF